MAEQQEQAKEQKRPPSEVHVSAVLWGGGAIACGIVAAVVASWLMWRHWDAPSGAQAYGAPNAGAVPQVERPLLQSAPQQDRAQYLAEKQKLLESWEWIDRRRGIARIPVEEAMKIAAARGGGTAAAPKESR